MSRPIILVDLDHTLADAAHRDHLIKHPMTEADWNKYHAGCTEDRSTFLGRLINKLSHDHLIFGLTGRNENHRMATYAWLVRSNIRMDRLIMRRNFDTTPAPKMKARALLRALTEEEVAAIVCIIDDHEGVCSHFTNDLDIPSLQVRLPKAMMTCEPQSSPGNRQLGLL